MSKYSHVFFDLDHTLWDFEKNAEETLIELFHHYNLSQFKDFTSKDFVRLYNENNKTLWDHYHKGKIDKEYLRTARFNLTFEQMGVPQNNIPTDIWELYLDICPTKPHLMPGAIEVLEYLKPKYHISIITNGFEKVQKIKLEHSGLKPYIDLMVSSEYLGVQKPDPAIFNHTLEKSKAKNHQTIMIGDNQETDIAGAKNAGIKAVWYNATESEIFEEPDYQITHLLQLTDVL